jgi:ABC-2 type transport system ATP-binding protein
LLGKITKQTYVIETQPALTEPPSVDGFSVELASDGNLELSIDQEQDMSGFFSAIADQPWRIKSVRSKSNRLEELFLSLVSSGQSLSAEEKS